MSDKPVILQQHWLIFSTHFAPQIQDETAHLVSIVGREKMLQRRGIYRRADALGGQGPLEFVPAHVSNRLAAVIQGTECDLLQCVQLFPHLVQAMREGRNLKKIKE